MHELSGITDRGHVRQRIEELIKRRIPAKRQQQGHNRHSGPKPDPPLLVKQKYRIGRSQRLPDGPKRDQSHQDAQISSTPGEARIRPAMSVIPVWIFVIVEPAWSFSRAPPIGSALKHLLLPLRQIARRIHAVTEQSGDHGAQHLCWWHAPLGRLVPTPRFGLRILAHTNHTLDLCADQSTQRMRGHQRREHGHQRHTPTTTEHFLDCRAFSRERLEQDKGSHKQTEQSTHIIALHQSDTYRKTRKNDLRDTRLPLGIIRSRKCQKCHPTTDGVSAYAPSRHAEEIRVQRRRNRPQQTRQRRQAEAPESHPGAQTKDQQSGRGSNLCV